ncbi:Strongly-conserved Zn-finger binding protein (TFIIIA) [Ascosphaera acerosa]|nr:Strongly-conserved Zn-finger binding protein (TFIIIA) [Ascosphaera acerosa]
MALPKRKAAAEADAMRKRLQTCSIDGATADAATAYPESPALSDEDAEYSDRDFILDDADADADAGHDSRRGVLTPRMTPSLSQPATTASATGEPAATLATPRTRYPSDRKVHRCPFDGCDKAFNRPARLQEHLRSHNNERIFVCTHAGCDKSFIRVSHLKHHVKSAHTTVRDYVCPRPECGKSFVTGTRLRRHMTAHEGRDKFRCTGYDGCSETFRKHSTLQRHIMSAHLGLKPFPCEECDAGFETAGHLRAHVARMHGESRFTCTECAAAATAAAGASVVPTTVTATATATAAVSDGSVSATPITAVSFPSYALLQAHIRTAHPPVCTTCGHICSTTRELRQHLDVAHGPSVGSGEAAGLQSMQATMPPKHLFHCPEPSCGRAFTRKGNLNVHVRTVHEGEKRFACGETDLSNSQKVPGYDPALHGCGKKYGSKLALEEHIRTAHLGLKTAKAEKEMRSMTAAQSHDGHDQSQAVSGTTDTPPSNHFDLTLLTGAAPVVAGADDGRHVPCLLADCRYRFHRDYDLWVHMSSQHHMGEGMIQWLLMRRAMSGAYESFDLAAEGLLVPEGAPVFADLESSGSDGQNYTTFSSGLDARPGQLQPDLSFDIFSEFTSIL